MPELIALIRLAAAEPAGSDFVCRCGRLRPPGTPCPVCGG